MRLRAAALLLTLGVLGLVVWRAELFTVARPGDSPRALARLADRTAVTAFDVSLPVVPVGVQRLVPGHGALLVHYWAPWERHSRAQVAALDSLFATLPGSGVRVAVVCFDPFPSVARYVTRARVRSPVLLDLRRDLQSALPCPSIPYTWLLDASGHVLARQAGEVDWLAPETRALLLEAERGTAGADTLVATSAPRAHARPGGSRPPGRAPARGAAGS